MSRTLNYAEDAARYEESVKTMEILLISARNRWEQTGIQSLEEFMEERGIVPPSV